MDKEDNFTSLSWYSQWYDLQKTATELYDLKNNTIETFQKGDKVVFKTVEDLNGLGRRTVNQYNINIKDIFIVEYSNNEFTKLRSYKFSHYANVLTSRLKLHKKALPIIKLGKRTYNKGF